VHRVNILSIGAMFGEIALISNNKRTASIKCLNYVTCATLTEKQVKDISRKYPEVLSKLKARRIEYNDCWKSFLRKLILSVEYFKNLNANTIEELIYSLRQEYYEVNKVLFKTGSI
jgi:CRP-like cAMP-binding protein